MHTLRLIALATGVLAIVHPGLSQDPYQSMTGVLKIYAVGDLEFGVQEKPGIKLECSVATGRLIDGSYEPSARTRKELAVVSGEAVRWEVPVYGVLLWLEGTFKATLGSTSVDVLAKSGTIRFADASPVLEAIRLNPDTLTISISDTANTQTFAAESLRTSGIDICRLAYACGNQHQISAACGSRVQPPSPDVQTLKRDIEAVLDRYPTTP